MAVAREWFPAALLQAPELNQSVTGGAFQIVHRLVEGGVRRFPSSTAVSSKFCPLPHIIWHIIYFTCVAESERAASGPSLRGAFRWWNRGSNNFPCAPLTSFQHFSLPQTCICDRKNVIINQQIFKTMWIEKYTECNFLFQIPKSLANKSSTYWRTPSYCEKKKKNFSRPACIVFQWPSWSAPLWIALTGRLL